MIEKNKPLFSLTIGEYEELQTKIIAEQATKMLDISSGDTPTILQKEILNIIEVSELTGYARQTIYGFVSDGKIPFLKRPGSKALRFNRTAILEWMSNSTKTG